MAQVVSLGYEPRKEFIPYHLRRQRWACIVAHRRCGKTVACIADLVDAALRTTRQNARFAYIAPYYAQAKDVAWTYVKQFATPVPGATINESELRVDFQNGARIRLHGCENYDRLRGIYLDGVVLDEPADFDPRSWPTVIRPALSDRKGWATFIGTPKGRSNSFAEIWQQAQDSDDWFSLMLRASETGLVAEQELADARKMLTAEQYAQEFECSFDAAVLGSYFGREIEDLEKTGRIGWVPYEPELDVHTSWDLGMGDSTSIWFFQIAPDGIRVIDHYENHGQPLSHYVGVLKSRPYRYGEAWDWVPHDARVRELGTGRTRIETLKELGRRPRVVPDHKLMDGINAARVTLPRCHFDAIKCKFGLSALRDYRCEYDQKSKTYRDRPEHDWTSHTADAFRYLAMAWRELVPEPAAPDVLKELVRPRTLNELLEEYDAEAG